MRASQRRTGQVEPMKSLRNLVRGGTVFGPVHHLGITLWPSAKAPSAGVHIAAPSHNGDLERPNAAWNSQPTPKATSRNLYMALLPVSLLATDEVLPPVAFYHEPHAGAPRRRHHSNPAHV